MQQSEKISVTADMTNECQFSGSFERTALLLGDDAMRRLASAHVILFGVGGVGGTDTAFGLTLASLVVRHAASQTS